MKYYIVQYDTAGLVCSGKYANDALDDTGRPITEGACQSIIGCRHSKIRVIERIVWGGRGILVTTYDSLNKALISAKRINKEYSRSIPANAKAYMFETDDMVEVGLNNDDEAADAERKMLKWAGRADAVMKGF